MALVLCTGVNSVLMQTRQLILEHAGHQVVTAIDESSVTAACKQNAFDVAVIGYAATTGAQQQIMLLIREHCPSARILELYRSATGKHFKDADSWLEVPVQVPQELAEHVTALANKARTHSF